MATETGELFDDQPDWSGRILAGRWHLGHVLGAGGMGTVYEGYERDGKRVAVKVLRPEFVRNRRARQRFLREASIASSINHPGVVPIIACDVADDVPYLVMDLLLGQSLNYRCKANDGRLLLGEVLRIADAVLDVLAVAHAQGIVHRDIKPGNVFVTLQGAIKVLDFGVARFIEEGGQAELSATRSGTTLGTPAFLSPEQARGRANDVDERTDLWAVGALMYSLLTGRHVHNAETPNEQLILSATQPAPALLAHAPHLPRAVGEVVDRALQLSKSDRWQDARSMQEAIRRIFMPDADPASQLEPTVEQTTPESERPIHGIQLVTNAPQSEHERTKTLLGLRVSPRSAPAIVLGMLGVLLGGLALTRARTHLPTSYFRRATSAASVVTSAATVPRSSAFEAVVGAHGAPTAEAAESSGSNTDSTGPTMSSQFPPTTGPHGLPVARHVAEVIPTPASANPAPSVTGRAPPLNSGANGELRQRLNVNDRSLDFRH